MNIASNEDGAVFLWIAVLCALCLIIAVGIIRVGYATVLVARAQNAADAAALSGAYEISHANKQKACSSAETTAQKNGAHVTSCKANDSEVIVEIEMTIDPTISARARAEIE